MEHTETIPQPEKILAEKIQEEVNPQGGNHEDQTLAEFDTIMDDPSDDQSPPHPESNDDNKDDEVNMDDKVEEDNDEEETAEDEDNSSKQPDVGLTSGHNIQPTPAQIKGSSLSTGSTSLSREELESLKVKKPLEYLKAMLSARHNFQDSSHSSSTPSGATSEVQSLDIILTEIKTKILDVDLFQVLRENATAHIDLKRILKQVNVLETSAQVSSLVIDLITLIDLVNADLNRHKDFSQQISNKTDTQLAEWDAVAVSTDKVSKL